MSVVIRQFKRGDLGKIDTIHSISVDRDAHFYEGMERLSWTMYEIGSETPIAAWGMRPHWEGFASVWSEFSVLALKKYPVAVAKNVRRRLEEHIKSLRLHRVQSMIYAHDKVSIHWIEWLGFHLEGKLEWYIDKTDVLLYARLIR